MQHESPRQLKRKRLSLRWDNAIVESFFGTLKNEMVNRCRFATREQASQEVFEYIEVWGQSAAPSFEPGLCQPRRVRAEVADRGGWGRNFIVGLCLTCCPPKTGKVKNEDVIMHKTECYDSSSVRDAGAR